MIESFLNKEDFLRTVKEAYQVASFVPPLIRWIHPPFFKVAIVFAHSLEQMKDPILMRYDYQCVSAGEVEDIVKQIEETVTLK